MFSLPNEIKSGQHQAHWPVRLFEGGIGTVIVGRFRLGGTRIDLGVFLIDTYCLGVKDAFYTSISASEYIDRLLPSYAEQEEMEEVNPACARKLIEQAVAYAQNLGFSPSGDYKKACRVFGGVKSGECSREFTFGKEGKPFFINGPNETEERSRFIVNQLTRSCGEGNFDFLVSTGVEGEDLDGSDSVDLE